jgi:hypothetical protein
LLADLAALKFPVLPPWSERHKGLFIGSLKLLKIQGRAWARPHGIDRVEYDITWN